MFQYEHVCRSPCQPYQVSAEHPRGESQGKCWVPVCTGTAFWFLICWIEGKVGSRSLDMDWLMDCLTNSCLTNSHVLLPVLGAGGDGWRGASASSAARRRWGNVGGSRQDRPGALWGLLHPWVCQPHYLQVHHWYGAWGAKYCKFWAGGPVLWSRAILLRLQLVNMAAPAPAPAL